MTEITTNEETVVNIDLDCDNIVNLLDKEPTESSMKRLHDISSHMMSSNQKDEGIKPTSAHMFGDLSVIPQICIPAQKCEKSNSFPHPEVEELCHLPPVDKEAKFMNS